VPVPALADSAHREIRVDHERGARRQQPRPTPEARRHQLTSRAVPQAAGQDQDKDVRLDKWLWAARFFKTRSLAAQAIAAGHVRIGAARAKAAHIVRPGELITIVIGPFQHVIGVRALSSVRRGAPEARLLYEETAESLAAREALAAVLKADRAAFDPAQGRPSKRDRRAIDRLRGR
jgi:ribosome-associated heat shock protein Hsp15